MKKRKMYNIMPNFAAPSHAYWTHGDHLGSTAWVTDTAGAGVQHFRYLPFGEPLYSKKTGTFSSRYTFSGKERDSESGLNYFGARYYNSDLSIWISVDPLSDKYPNLSPYTYCADNPVRLVDPDGRDWVEREVDGRKEVYYDRHVKSQTDVNKKYGKSSGVKHLADGSKVGDGAYTVYNDHESNKLGIMKDANGNIVNQNRTIIYGENYTLFAGVTDESVNAETLHKNLMGTSYTGGNNPQSYNQDDNYDYNPSNLSELFSIIHDKQYDNLGAVGIKGALLQTNTWKADLQLAVSNASSISINPDLKDKMRSAATAVTFGYIGTYKMVIDYTKRGWNYAKKNWNKLMGN